ncbi:MAG: 1,2-phenylacetyl-CoA epoxidase subunit PaaE [Sporichthyaceae bacterium]
MTSAEVLDAAPARAAFHRLSVSRIERLTDDAVAVDFDVPAELAEAYRFAAGQHLTIRSDHGGPGSRRSYSIAAPVGGPLRIGVKHLPGGAFSTWATHDLRVGDALDVMTPAGTFGACADRTSGRHVVALAAGSGITPILSIVATVLAAEPDSTVTLFYGSRSSDAVMFAEDLEDLKNRHPARFALFHFLSREPQVIPLRYGRLDASKLRELLGAVAPLDAEDWYLCGPGEAVEEWREVLTEAGVPGQRIHRELFHAGPVLRTPQAATTPSGRLQFTLDGRTSSTAFQAGDTVLDAVLRVRPDAPFACRGGVCGTCRAGVASGSVDMDANYALEVDELARGFVLTCQARPTTDVVVVDFDR